MKTRFYKFRKIIFVLLLLFAGAQVGFSQIDADIDLLSVSPSGPYHYGDKVTYTFRITNKSDPNFNYDIDKVVLRDSLPAGLEFNQADNSLTWTDVGSGVIEATANDLIPAGGGTHDYSIVLTVKGTDGGVYDWRNKIELYKYYNGIWEMSLNDPDRDQTHNYDRVYHKFDVFDLALKSATGNVYPDYGTNVTFDITVYNQGSMDATDVTVVNYTLPGYTFDPNNNTGWTFDNTTGNWKYTFPGPIAPGDSETKSIVLKLNPAQNQDDWANYAEIVSAEDGNGNAMDDVDGTFDEDYSNDAGGKPGSAADDAIDGDGTGTVDGSDPATDEDNHDPGYVKIFDLALTKTTDETTLLAYGDDFTFHFTVYNQGTVPVKNIEITDYLPDGYYFNAADNPGWSSSGNALNYTIPLLLQPGNSTTIDLNLAIIDVATDISGYINYSEISAADDENGNSFNDNDDADSDMNSNTTSEREVLPGSPYDDDIWRTGENGYQDDFDPGIAYFLDLALKQTVVTPGPYHAGTTADEIKFSIKIYNQGGVTVRDIDLMDYIPDGYEFAQNSFATWHYDAANNQASATIDDVLAPGDSIEEFIYLTILPVNDKFDSYVNIVEISGVKDEDFNILTDDIDSEMDEIKDNDAGGQYRSDSDDSILGNGTGQPGDTNAFTDEDDSDPALPDVYDMAIKSIVTTPGPYSYGQDLTFKFIVYNQGNMPVKDVEIKDYMPNGYTVSNAPGWTVSGQTLTYTFNQTLQPGDTAFVEAVFKTKMTNGGEKDWIHYAEVSAMKNLNDANISGWDLDSDLNSHNQEEMSVELGSPDDDDIWVRGPYMDEDEDDNDPAGIEIFDLAMQKIINTIYYPFEYGDNIPFKITVFNQGSIEAQNIKITDTITCGYEFVLANNPGWVEDALNHRVEYTLTDPLAPGASVDIILNLKVKQCTEEGDSWVNKAEISYAEDYNGNDMSDEDIDSYYDDNLSNDPGGTPDTPEDNKLDGDGKNGPGNGYDKEEDDHDVARMHVFDLALKKSLADPDPHYGDVLTFNITVYNQGNDDATNIDIKDYEPEGYVFDPALNPGWSGNINIGLSYTYTGTLAAKDSVIIPLKLKMVGTDGGDDYWINYAEITDADNATNSSYIYLDPDSTPDSNTSEEQSVKPGDPDDDNIYANDKGGKEDDHDPAGPWVYDLALKKEIVTQGPYMPGDTVEYKVTVYNQGNKLVREVQVVDYCPTGLKYCSESFPQWHYDTNTGNSHASISNAINPGESVTLSLYYTVNLVDEKCKDAYTNNAEIFEFRDENLYVVNTDIDSKPDYDATNDIGGTPDSPEDNHIDDDGHDYNNDGITDEDDSDPAKLEIIDMALKAELVTAAPYYYGQTQQFRVRVYNQGNDTIAFPKVKGYIPDGYEIDWAANPGWNSADTTYTINDSIPNCDSMDIFLNLKMVMTSGGEKDWVNYFEVVQVLNKHLVDRTTWDMDSKLGSDTDEERSVELGDSNDDNILVRGEKFDEDQDDHDPAGMEIFDLALTKSFDDSYPHYYGDTIHFEIKLYNQGSIATKNQEVTDYIPAGYIFDQTLNPDWTYDSGTGMATTVVADTIAPGDTVSTFINLVLTDSYEQGDDWENGAEISAFQDTEGNDQSGNDFDSTNDQIKSNDPGLDDDDFIGGDGKNGPTHGYPQIEDDADLAIVPVFDLALKKTTVTAGPYHYGDDITFKVEVFNQGNQVAENIELNDYIALGYTFNAADNPGWTFSSGTAHYTLPNQLQPDQSTSVNIVLRLERTDGGYDNWINYAEIASADNPDGIHDVDADSHPDSDAAHERDVKPGSADDDKIDGQYISEQEDEDDHDPAGIDIFDLALRKTIETSGPTFDYGQQIDFKIEIFNQGNTDATNITLEEEAIPCGFEFDVAANTDWTYNANNKTATYTYTGTLKPGETAEVHVFMTVWDCHNDDWQNSWKNQVEITSAEDGDGNTHTGDIDSQYDNDPGNDPIVDDALQLTQTEDDDDSDIAIAIIDDLALRIKAVDRGPFAPGEIAAFSIKIYNQGNDSLRNIKIYDYISPGYSFVSGTQNPGWSMYNSTTAQYVYGDTLAPRDSFEVIINLKVEMSTNIEDWTHYAEVAEAVNLTGLVLQDDADGVFASDTPYERQVKVFDPWDNEILGIGYKRTPYEDMDDHDPASVDVVGKVGDWVWEDKDGDGIQDPGEPGVEGVIVELHNCDGNLGMPVQYDTTDASGHYLFDMVIPGQYYLKFILPDEYEFTLPDKGVDDEKDSDVTSENGYGTTACFQVNANDEKYDMDAGTYICVPVGDLVWLDDNMNDVYDVDENGVNGLKVELYRLTDGVWVLWDHDYTGINPNSVCGDGYYYFCTNPGTYFLRFVTPPQGLVPAQPHKGGDHTKDSDITRAHGYGTTNTFTLISGTPGDLTLDAGYYDQAKVTNSLAWVDSNLNGLRDPGENGVPNMLVEIYDVNGELYSSTWTDQDGNYDLDYLQAESFYLKFHIPYEYASSYGFTQSNQGDDTKDSDVTGSYGYGTTEIFTLQPDEEKQHQDAGLAQGSLPLNWLNVGAEYRKTHTAVYWTTANEKNIERYVIQRSYDNANSFVDIGEVKPKDGESNAYEYDDFGKFENGVYYYRVVEIDLNGVSTKSKVVAVFIGADDKNTVLDVFPNPAYDDVTLRFGRNIDSDVKIDLLDITGKLAIGDIVSDRYQQGLHETTFNVDKLRPSTYYIRMRSGDNVVFKKLIVINK